MKINKKNALKLWERYYGDNSIKTIKIKPDSVSLNNEVKCWKPVFMWISGI